MTSLAMKVAMLFKALATLLLLGWSMMAVIQWICPFILPWEFAAYYCVGAIGVAVTVAFAALFRRLGSKVAESRFQA